MLMTQKCMCLAQTFVQFYIQLLASWLPKWLIGEQSAWQCRRCRFDLCVWKIPRWGNWNPLLYSYLENFMDRGSWWNSVQGVAKKSDTTESLRTHALA